MQRFLITAYLAIFIISFAAELIGFGLISRYRTGEMYEIIAVTGRELFFVISYFIFCLLLPFVTVLTLLRRRELTIPVEHINS